jgi:hypothetical protein
VQSYPNGEGPQPAEAESGRIRYRIDRTRISRAEPPLRAADPGGPGAMHGLREQSGEWLAPAARSQVRAFQPNRARQEHVKDSVGSNSVGELDVASRTSLSSCDHRHHRSEEIAVRRVRVTKWQTKPTIVPAEYEFGLRCRGVLKSEPEP